MHSLDLHQGAERWIWLVSGIGEGPSLAAALLSRGWSVQVSVVTAAAARAYPPHPQLRLAVGALQSDAAVERQLEQLQPRWLVDATHPFAEEISARLERVCHRRRQPLVRLARAEPPPLPGRPPRLLHDLEALGSINLHGERLLLAIGSRQLPQALAASNATAHFARVLDQPGSLQLALAAGLRDEQLACLRPDRQGRGHLEQALCRRWRISSVLCRQSGGRNEALWRQVCSDLNLQLLLLRRRDARATGLPLEALLEKLGQP